MNLKKFIQEILVFYLQIKKILKFILYLKIFNISKS